VTVDGAVLELEDVDDPADAAVAAPKPTVAPAAAPAQAAQVQAQRPARLVARYRGQVIGFLLGAASLLGSSCCGTS
jgi:hypothetical protein